MPLMHLAIFEFKLYTWTPLRIRNEGDTRRNVIKLLY